MPLFLIAFLTIYGAMHAYVFFRLRSIFSAGQAVATFLVTWFTVMAVAPLLVRLLESAGLERMALWLAWPGYSWMGFLFLLTVLFMATEPLCLIRWLSCGSYGYAASGFFSAVRVGTLVLLTATAASVYAVLESNLIRSEHVTIRTDKLPAGSRKIRVVQISDVHLGLLLQEKRLEKILRAVRQAQPDILVSTGDLVDGRFSQEESLSKRSTLAAMLSAIAAPQGKFAVTGNHEVYAGLEPAIAFTSAAGFKLLRNSSVTLPCRITISGIDDPAVSSALSAAQRQQNQLFATSPPDSYHLLLKHRPLITPGSDGRFDLQLSGHVHKGQLFPFNLIVRQRFPIPCGTTKTTAGSLIHVSRGSGTWGPPMRLFAPPEVTVIDILPKDG